MTPAGRVSTSRECSAEHVAEGLLLNQHRAIAERAHRHHGARTSTPAPSNAARAARAIATAPGESPWTQRDAASVRMIEPSTAFTVPSVASRTARRGDRGDVGEHGAGLGARNE